MPTVAASGAFPLPPLPGMFPASAGGDATTTAAASTLSKKPPSDMSAAEYVAAANAPRESKTAAGVEGNVGTGFQWEDVLKAGREGKLDVNTNGDEVGGEGVAAAGGAAAAADPAAAAPAAAAVPAKRTPPFELPVASPAAGAASKSAAAWVEVMEAGRKGTLDLDTTGAKASAAGSGAAAAPAAAPAAGAP